MTPRLLSLLLLLASALLGPRARAHGARTAYLELSEASPGQAAGVWKIPTPTRDAWPSLEGCDIEVEDPRPAAVFVSRLRVSCPGPLAGRLLAVRGLGPSINEAVVRLSAADGATASQVLSAARPSWRLPRSQRALDLVPRYVALGVEHILSGADHLLFVLGLVLLAPRARGALLTATAFTLAHSLTLAATALGWLRLSPIAAEASIALSLVLVGLDIGRDRAGHTRGLAFVFGLVHGLGFAEALREAGLPERGLGVALFSFNIGVELGQLAFIAALLLALAAWRRLAPARHLSAPTLAGAYLIGCLGAFWLIERVSRLLPSSQG